MKKLRGFLEITAHAEPCLSPAHDYEKAIYSKIKNGLESFRLKDIMRSKSSDKAYRARFELCMQGQLIIVKGCDVAKYSLSALKYAPHELIAITYQHIRTTVERNKKDPKGVTWQDIWVEHYNDWVRDYSAQIWEGVSI